MKPLATNSMVGTGSISSSSPALPAGLYSSDTGTAVTYTFGLNYNKSGTNPQGNIQLVIERSDGTYYIKSNSITSIAFTNPVGSSFYNATVYTKASIYKIANGVTTSVDGNVTLRMDLYDSKSNTVADKIGFTVLSSKTSALYYSNNWVYDTTTKSFRTVLQDVLGGITAVGIG